MGVSIARWLCAGLLAFGVLIAPPVLLSGAGVAYADTGADSESGKPASSAPDSPGQQESESPDTTEPDDGPDPDDVPGPVEEEPAEEDDADSKKPVLRTVERVRDHVPNSGGLVDEAPEDEQPVEEAAEPERVAVTERPLEHRVARTAVAQVAAVTSRVTVAEAPEAATAAAQPAPTAAATAAGPNLINIVGTLFFNVFDNIVKFFEGPPAVPPGRAVRVARTPLELDCGNGRTVDADWYFPTETTPDKVIYFQHGGFARAGLYNVTAADLAVRNNAIVVAPSITSNFFECAGCQLGADQMHAAVADLFLGDRGAMLASARAAGWEAALPQRFVIAGHSEGGQLAAGAAGFYARAAGTDRLHDLAGVLLLDTSPVGGAVERGVRSIPLDIPVHHISAAPALLNSYGDMDKVLGEIRPGFVGLRLIGGVHADAWQSSNGLGKLVVGLAFGFSQRQNVEAVQALSAAWISDWFGGTVTDAYYGERGEVISFDTPEGTVRAYVIPGPAPRLTMIDRFLKSMIESTVFLRQFTGNCAADPAGTPNSGGSLLLSRNSTGDTALSLDGRRQTGQSVLQQCRRG